MHFIITKDSVRGEEIKLAYSDYGQGKPVILIHGWPLSREMWEYQLEDLVSAGLRVIKYDRRGFGASSKPWDGYHYDNFAADLKAIIEQLDLKDVTLVGFSMGGGEVARYLSKYGSSRVAKVVFISSVLPYLLKTKDNNDGVGQDLFDEMIENIKQDRIDFLSDFGKKFFGVSMVNKTASSALLDYYVQLASKASQQSTVQCVRAFSATDFRNDIKAVNVPALIIHGDDDKTVPIKLSSDRLAKMLPNAIYRIYPGAPHGLFYTERLRLNRDLVSFIKTGKVVDPETADVRDTTIPVQTV